jgi:hypothetical protein
MAYTSAWVAHPIMQFINNHCFNNHHHHEHPGLGHLARSVSRVTVALSIVSLVPQLFSFLVGFNNNLCNFSSVFTPFCSCIITKIRNLKNHITPCSCTVWVFLITILIVSECKILKTCTNTCSVLYLLQNVYMFLQNPGATGSTFYRQPTKIRNHSA